MQITKINSQTFQGIKISANTPGAVVEAIEKSNLLQDLGKTNKVTIRPFTRNIVDKELGNVIEYGLKYRVGELNAHTRLKFNILDKSYITKHLLPKSSISHRDNRKLRQHEIIIENMVNEIESLTKQDLKNWFG